MGIRRQRHAGTGLLILALFFAGAARISAGFVRTVEGKLIEGELRFGPAGALIVQGQNGSAITVPLATLQRATFAATEEALAASGLQLEGWTAEDVGSVARPGTAGFVEGKWYLQSGGGYIGEKSDGCHFAGTSIRGDCEIQVQVTGLKCKDRQGRAGVMLRESAEGGCKFAAVLVKADGTFSFRGRNQWGKNAEVKHTGSLPVPGWIKLTKYGKDFEAFKSPDGEHWASAGKMSFLMEEEFKAGLAASNRNRNDPCTAVAEHLQLTVNGLMGEYFTDATFSDRRCRRIDPQINFTWGLGSPDPRIGPDTFSVRWTGQVRAQYSEEYFFHFDADDRAELWIEGQPMPYRSLKTGSKKQSNGMRLEAGRRYALEMKFKEGGGSALARLGWSSQRQPLEVISASHFYCEIKPDTAAATAPPRNLPGQIPLARGILLRSGTFLAGSIRSFDEAHVKLAGQNGKEHLLALHNIALIAFRQPDQAVSLHELGGRTGALLKNGEFFAGDIQGIEHRKLIVSSVLYGLRDFDQNNGEVIAWLLNEATPISAPFEVQSVDGSVFLAQTVSWEKDELVMDEVSLGAFRIPQMMVKELKRFGH